MTEQFKAAILTKSNKRRANNDYGSCVAGVTESGEWIRFVADREGDSIPSDVEIEAGEIISANGDRAPLTYQRENVVLKDFRAILDDDFSRYVNNIRQIKETGIFGNTANHLTPREMRRNNGTLRLLEVQELEVYWDERQHCKTRFSYNGIPFEDMSMTDPKHYTKKGSPPEYIGDTRIVVSLPNKPVFNKFIKFIAAIYSKKSLLWLS